MAVLVSISIGAEDGDKSIPTYLPDSTTLAQAQGFLTGFAPLIDAITGGVIQSASVSFDLTLPGGLKTDQVGDVSVHRGGLFGYRNTSPYKWSQFVPTLTESLFIGEAVNVGDTDVGAYATAMEDGITVSGTAIQPTNEYGNDLTSNVTATQSFRK